MYLLEIGMAGVFLLGCTWFDIKTLKIPLWLLAMGSAAGLTVSGLEIFLGTRAMPELLLSILPGISLLVIAIFARRQIGSGDGWMILNMGLILGVKNTLFSVEMGFFFLLFPAFWFYSIRKERKKILPLAPFLFAGSSLVALGGILGIGG
jgi:Flp pilus assembly protein protease CpaA